MPIPIEHTLGMLGDNLDRRKNVLTVHRRRSVAWTKGLGLSRGGATILYTGQMYQLVPAVNAMSTRLGKMENGPMARYFGFARRLNRVVNLGGLMARGKRSEVREATESLRNIARLLVAAGVQFGYLGAEDRYAGALAHDEGLDDVLVRHARRVYAALKAHGVRELITVDPHTTNMLRTIYPKIVPGFDLKVRTYLEVLAERPPAPVRSLDTDVTVHDSCIYARREGVMEQPRVLLRRGGVRIHEAELSGRATQCCGGPVEMLFPTRAHAIAAARVEQLGKVSPRVVTLCPLCLTNLRRAAPAGMEVRDVSEYLVRAYCPLVSPTSARRPADPTTVGLRTPVGVPGDVRGAAATAEASAT